MAYHHAVVYSDTFRTLIERGVRPERARHALNRAFVRVRRRRVGLGDDAPVPDSTVPNPSDIPSGAADPAGQSWLDRTSQIQDEYNNPSYDRAALHNEAATAMLGISALLSARLGELSDQMVQWLYAADDTLNKIQAGTLSATFESPWKSATSTFVQTIKQEVTAGGKALANPLSIVPWWAWPLVALVGLAAAKSLLKF